MAIDNLNKEARESKNKHREKLAKIFIVLGSLLLIGTVFSIKFLNPNVDWKWIWIVIGIIIFVAATFFIIFYLFSLKKQREDIESERVLPLAITMEQARELAIKATESPEYHEYTRAGKGEKIKHAGHGNKTWIYCRRSQGQYTRDWFFVIINMHFPDKKTILTLEDDLGLLWFNHPAIISAVNDLSESPIRDPDIITRVSENPIFGSKEMVEKIIQEKEEEKNKEEKNKEDKLE